MSLSTKIMIGMGLGVLAGIFFGEEAQYVDVIGQVFIQLLQMSVLPFLMLSLITGLGSLTYDAALSLAKKAGSVILVLWSLVLTVVAALPLTFPNWKSAMFFSPALVEEPHSIDFLEMYIPANPFFSLANAMIPAVVIFSLMVGITLMGLERKHALLDVLGILLKAMASITSFVMKLAPIGVFAISASASGSLAFEDLGRLQVYLISYVAASLLLTFWVLPGLVALLTPISYGNTIRAVRGVLITAFATGNTMIILPMLTESGRALLRRSGLTNEDTEGTIEVIIPTAYTFPSSGLLLSLTFIPFAGWFMGFNLPFTQYPSFLVSGLISLFGGAVVGIPFLLDLFRIPGDAFKLFVAVDVFTGRFSTLTAAMHMYVLGLLGACLVAGRLKVHWRKVLGYCAVTITLGVTVFGSTGLFFANAINPEYTKYQAFVEMDLKYDSVKATVRDLTSGEQTSSFSEKSSLAAIRDRGVLRVGFTKDSLPFAFTNKAGKLVGFDIEMAYLLAKDLNVIPEFIRLPGGGQIDQYLNAHVCDIAMTGRVFRPGMAERATTTRSYLDGTLAFIVKDYNRANFSNWEILKGASNLKLGLPTASAYYRKFAERLLPEATIISLNSPRDFFKNRSPELDGLLFLAEPGSAWTLIYPAYTVVVPLPKPIKIPFVYYLPKNDQSLERFVNGWIQLKKMDGTVDAVFDHWILGQGAMKKQPRWSIIRNVLHWID